jgi:hypothetical protein
MRAILTFGLLLLSQLVDGQLDLPDFFDGLTQKFKSGKSFTIYSVFEGDTSRIGMAKFLKNGVPERIEYAGSFGDKSFIYLPARNLTKIRLEDEFYTIQEVKFNNRISFYKDEEEIGLRKYYYTGNKIIKVDTIFKAGIFSKSIDLQGTDYISESNFLRHMTVTNQKDTTSIKKRTHTEKTYRYNSEQNYFHFATTITTFSISGRIKSIHRQSALVDDYYLSYKMKRNGWPRSIVTSMWSYSFSEINENEIVYDVLSSLDSTEFRILIIWGQAPESLCPSSP